MCAFTEHCQMPKSGRMHLGIWAYLSRHDLFALVSVTSNHFLVVWYIWPQELCSVRGERFIGVRRIFSCLCLQGIQLLLGAVPRTLHQLCNSSTRAAEAVLVFHPHPEGRRARFSLAVRLLELVCGDFAFFSSGFGDRLGASSRAEHQKVQCVIQCFQHKALPNHG